MLCKFCVLKRKKKQQQNIYISVGEIELLCNVFLAALPGKQASPTMPTGLNERNVGISVCQ